MDYVTIVLSKADGIATITLNRPQKLHALTPRMTWEESPQAIAEVEVDGETRVLIITGAGQGFCFGADMSGFAAEQMRAVIQPESSEPRESRYGWIERLRSLPKPTIAVIME